ncbi:hypothetical protein GH714_039263 [Hevea brasiliensis]|uniref:Uncharacterized protein n=1 Tax=Hevea brasiliensis TaxID=3981 RepID=A0A6A6LXY0_HEVBR|nr:hypothetical protein GH714_039263 [Hevea brasiliensis]
MDSREFSLECEFSSRVEDDSAKKRVKNRESIVEEKDSQAHRISFRDTVINGSRMELDLMEEYTKVEASKVDVGSRVRTIEIRMGLMKKVDVITRKEKGVMGHEWLFLAENPWKAEPVVEGGGSRFQFLREHVDELGTKRGRLFCALVGMRNAYKIIFPSGFDKRGITNKSNCNISRVFKTSKQQGQFGEGNIEKENFNPLNMETVVADNGTKRRANGKRVELVPVVTSLMPQPQHHSAMRIVDSQEPMRERKRRVLFDKCYGEREL